MATVEVLWEPLAGSGHTVPLPAHLERRPTVGLVGRAAEIRSMTDAGKRVFSGEGREVQLVSGEAGMGKTTLVAEVARLAFDSGACVLFGHSEEGLATPYQLFAEALGHYVTHAPEEQLLAHVEVHGSELVRLVPALASRIPDLPPSKATDTDSERFLLFAAVVGLLAEGSALQPIVLVLDDLQWADNGQSAAAPSPGCGRTGHADARPRDLSRQRTVATPIRSVDTLAALHRQAGVSRIDLEGSMTPEWSTLMEATAGHTLDDGGGGPRPCRLPRDRRQPVLRERGAAPSGRDGRHLPGRRRAVGGRRHARRHRPARPVSRGDRRSDRAAGQGLPDGCSRWRRSSVGTSISTCWPGRPRPTEEELLDILDAAAAVGTGPGIGRHPGRFSFAHALIQHTLYEDLGPNRRARAHRQVAEALEDLCGDRPGARVGELARHWTVATQPVDLAKAIDYSRQAGDAALSALAPADALALLRPGPRPLRTGRRP